MGTLSFTSVKGLRPKKNRFNKSYLKAFPSTMGKLVPVHTDFIIPGSWVELKSSLFTRTQALVAPVMDNISTYVHYWKIPIRLLDKKFTKFIGGEIKPEEYNPAVIIPSSFLQSFDETNLSNLAVETYEYLHDIREEYGDLFNLLTDEKLFNSSLLDLLGYNGNSEFWINYDGILNLFEFKAYLLLLKVWYTNENITIRCPLYVMSRGDSYTQEDNTFLEVIEDFMELEGDISYMTAALYLDLIGNFGVKALFNHAWAKDYFTSALPNTQYGEEVTIPLADSAPVSIGRYAPDGTVNKIGLTSQSSTIGLEVTGQGINGNTSQTVYAQGSEGEGTLKANNSGITMLEGYAAANTSLKGTADLSEASAISILELRIAETLQVYKERIMRAGRKYREYLKMFFNVVSSDARLQDPEWLGGGKVALQVGDIEQTSATDSVSPQGNLAGKGTQFGANFAGFKTWCEEWCIIIGVGYMQPKARYCQGIERNKLKSNDLYDWFNPTFERIGEQPIKMAEIYAGADVSADDIFGYQRRYAEYTFKNDQMHGAFKNSLSFWTAGLRIFDSKPALNQQFIYVQPGVFDRIFAVAEAENDGNILFWWQHAYYVKQPVSKFGTPGLHLY